MRIYNAFLSYRKKVEPLLHFLHFDHFLSGFRKIAV